MFPSVEQLQVHRYNQMVEEYGEVAYKEDCGQYTILLCQRKDKSTPLVLNNGGCYFEVGVATPLNSIIEVGNETFINFTKKINKGGSFLINLVKCPFATKVHLKNSVAFYNALFFQ